MSIFTDIKNTVTKKIVFTKMVDALDCIDTDSISTSADEFGKFTKMFYQEVGIALVSFINENKGLLANLIANNYKVIVDIKSAVSASENRQDLDKIVESFTKGISDVNFTINQWLDEKSVLKPIDKLVESLKLAKKQLDGEQ